MHDDATRLREALAKIAEIAGSAAQQEYTSNRVAEDGGSAGDGVRDVGCSVKRLPARLHMKAARTAAKINPVNAPLQEPLGRTLGVAEPLRLAVETARYWGPTPRMLTVSFMDSTPADLRARIVSHLNAWTSTGGISFAETSGTGEVRISRGPGGYYSYLGTDVLLIPANHQTMNLEGFTMNTPESEFRRVVRHEAGHTLGFPHEHMRAELVARIDPEKAYPYFWETQGWDQQTVDQQVLTPLDQASIFGTAPDEDSIMCYQLPGRITYDGQPIRGGADINATDFAFAGLVYPKLPFFSPTDTVAQSADEWAESEDVPEPV